MNKYKNKKTLTFDGILHDSRKEANRLFMIMMGQAEQTMMETPLEEHLNGCIFQRPINMRVRRGYYFLLIIHPKDMLYR